MVDEANDGACGEDPAIGAMAFRPYEKDREPLRAGFAAGATALMGAAATAASCVLGVVLVLVFAATLAVVFVLTAALAVSSALAWRFKRLGRPLSERRSALRRIGHSWIAYGQA